MPFNRDPIPTLIARAQADIESHLAGSDPRVRRYLLYIATKMHAAAIHGNYGHLDWLAKQLFPDTAEGEYLERWAAIWDVTRLLATQAAGNVDFTGTNAAVIPAGTELQTSDGMIYTTDAEVTITGGVATAAVTSVEAGTAEVDVNLDAGIKLTLVIPIVGVNSQATVAAGGITGGSDREDDESLRARLLQRLRNPSQGGSDQDYIRWAKEAHQDVTHVWPAANETGPNTVTLRIMTYGTTANGIPTQTVLDAVADYINDGRKPWTVTLDVVAPIPVALDITISNLVPNTQGVKDAIEASVEDLLRRVAEPGGTIFVSQIREAISLAAGEESHTLDAPLTDPTYDTGEIPVLGMISYP